MPSLVQYAMTSMHDAVQAGLGNPADCKSLLKANLTRELFQAYCMIPAPKGLPLDQTIAASKVGRPGTNQADPERLFGGLSHTDLSAATNND